MAVVKRLICLANSRKLSGRCVAGKEKEGLGPWVRPVSDRPHQEVSEYESHYKDGTEPKILDIIDIPLKGYHPSTYQTENWLLDPDSYWARAGRATWDELSALADKTIELWVNGFSTYNGSNDRVTLADAEQLCGSLFLLHLDELHLRVFASGADFGNPKRRVQATFWYRGVKYALWVTDPAIEQKYLAGDNGDYNVAECFVTVSLGEPKDGYCYKLVATVITREA